MDEWLKQRKSYWWWVKDVTKLERESVLEAIMNYGTWGEFLYLKKRWGRTQVEQLFDKMTKNRTRINLRKAPIALYSNYFAKYAH